MQTFVEILERDAVKSGINLPRLRRDVGEVLPNCKASRPKRQYFYRHRHGNLKYLFCRRNLNYKVKAVTAR